MMKTKKARNAQIYLQEYFTGRVDKSFYPERDKDILYWDFLREVCETVKAQIEFKHRFPFMVICNSDNNFKRSLINFNLNGVLK